jgi:hypothetical protein
MSIANPTQIAAVCLTAKEYIDNLQSKDPARNSKELENLKCWLASLLQLGDEQAFLKLNNKFGIYKIRNLTITEPIDELEVLRTAPLIEELSRHTETLDTVEFAIEEIDLQGFAKLIEMLKLFKKINRVVFRSKGDSVDLREYAIPTTGHLNLLKGLPIRTAEFHWDSIDTHLGEFLRSNPLIESLIIHSTTYKMISGEQLPLNEDSSLKVGFKFTICLG